MNKLEFLSKIFSIKRIIAFVLTIVFSYMAMIGEVQASEYITIYSMIIAFYFGHSLTKKQ